MIAERVGDETVALDVAGDLALRLNATATLLWEALARPRSVAELAAELERRYGLAPDRALADAGAFVADLHERGLLALD